MNDEIEITEEELLERIANSAAYYRANPHRFVRDFLHVHLKLFQKILIFMMDRVNYFCWIAARGMSKTFLTAVYCCVRCVLYPGTKICIASGTIGQSINILEKIKSELMTRSPELTAEIENITISPSRGACIFHNGSMIKVVTASDSSRGNRANLLICDEFRMVDQDIITSVLRKFLNVERHPGYLDKPEYAHLTESNKELYLSSAWFKDHWSWTKVTDYAKSMLDDTRKYFVCGFPYHLSIFERLLSRETVENEMLEESFNEVSFSMEMEALFFGDEEGSFFEYNNIAATRKLEYPMMPSELAGLCPGAESKMKIPPKKAGEIRLLSADIALMATVAKRHTAGGSKTPNDATAIFVNQVIKTGQRSINNIVYTENLEGAHTADQALRLRKLFVEYDCDYIVLDVKGVGLGVYDALIRDITDPRTGVVYPPLTCCNNKELADRCSDPRAEKAIWAINGTARLNSESALLLREGFKSGKIRLLMSEFDAENQLSELKGWSSLTPTQKVNVTLPYINTTLLVNELINLQYVDNDGFIKIIEKNGYRKDRYSSLSYNYYVSTLLEAEARKRKQKVTDIDAFVFRAPKSKR